MTFNLACKEIHGKVAAKGCGSDEAIVSMVRLIFKRSGTERVAFSLACKEIHGEVAVEGD